MFEIEIQNRVEKFPDLLTKLGKGFPIGKMSLCRNFLVFLVSEEGKLKVAKLLFSGKRGRHVRSEQPFYKQTPSPPSHRPVTM